jgi:hypothetical protein
MPQKIYQTLIRGVRCNVTRERSGYVVRRVTESGKSHTVLARNAESEAAAIALAEAALNMTHSVGPKSEQSETA